MTVQDAKGSSVVPACDALEQAIERGTAFLQGNELEFFRRVWRTDPAVYRERLRAIALEGMEMVLDAGSGMGQWTHGLSGLNHHVCAIDNSKARLSAAGEVLTALGANNVSASQQSVECIAYPEDFFDGIFCYSVIMMTDYQKTVREFYRLLKPGGTVYIGANGLGYYLANLLRPRNASPSYDPRAMAARAIERTLEYFADGNRHPGEQLVIGSRHLARTMAAAGFVDIEIGAEGTLQRNLTVRSVGFFPVSEEGLENVYEIMARKP